MSEFKIEQAGPTPARLGESPVWSVAEQALYYVDIAAHQVLRLGPDGRLKQWQMDAEPGCIALTGGGLLVGRRDGLWYLDTTRTGVVGTAFHFGTIGDTPAVGDWIDAGRTAPAGTGSRCLDGAPAWGRGVRDHCLC